MLRWKSTRDANVPWTAVLVLSAPALLCAGLQTDARPSTSGAALPTGHRVPFRFNPPLSPYVVVQARINGRGQALPFLVDTGASSALMIDGRVAQRMKLLEGSGRQIAVTSLLLTGATERDAYRYSLSTSTGPAIVANMSVVRRGSAIPTLAGIIGIPLFLSRIVRIDFDRQWLTLFDPRHPPHPLAGGQRVPLESEDGADGASGFYVTATAPTGDRIRLLLDLGSHETVVPVTFGVRRRRPVMTTATYNEMDSFGIASRRVLPSLRMGSMRIDRLAVAASLATDDQLLGNDFLRRYLVTLDGPGRRLTLKRRAGYARLCKPLGWTGASIDAESDRFIVSSVASPSPAHRANIKPGDELLSVDGVLVRGLESQVARRLLAGQQGSTARVQLRRNGRLSPPLRLGRENEFHAPAAAVDGLTLMKRIKVLPDAAEERPEFEVAQVQPGCSADRAGIRKGDLILALHGIPAKRIVSLADLKTSLFEPRIVLLVAAKAGKPARTVVLKALAGR